MNKKISSIPSAKRLITSLRDLGYGFVDAVAEIVDNSIQAHANFVQVKLCFAGEDSYLLVLDNGRGMAPDQIREAMRFGSNRIYGDEDLGRFGLGLKTASLSQCDELIVSSRQGKERARINSYMWSMDHVGSSDRWEILSVSVDSLPTEVASHLNQTTGTVVCWKKLNRLMGYRWPEGKYAEREAARLVDELVLGLGAIFHRFLTGEILRKRVGIFVNDRPVEPWDPFCRSEKHTQKLPEFRLPVTLAGKTKEVTFLPYLLPPSQAFSSTRAFVRAGGLKKWNKQQGIYVYRAGRLLQSGGWCGLRTADEHTKLVRVSVDIPDGMDEAFKVNVSKMRVSLPREIKEACLHQLTPIVKAGQDRYRTTSDQPSSVDEPFLDENIFGYAEKEFRISPNSLKCLIEFLVSSMSPSEKRVLYKGLQKLGKNAILVDSRSLDAA